MNASNHGRRAAVKAVCKVVCVPVAVLFAVAATADGASSLFGAGAGMAVVLAVPVACWLIFRERPARHPAPARRVAPGRDPEATAPLTLTESNEPARIAA